MTDFRPALDEGEPRRFDARLHPALWVRPSAVLGIGLFAFMGGGGPAAVVALGVGAVDLAQRGLRALRNELLITDRRVLARGGMLRVREAAVDDPSRVEVLQDGFARRFDFAFVRLPDRDGRPLALAFIANADALRGVLEALAGSDRG